MNDIEGDFWEKYRAIVREILVNNGSENIDLELSILEEILLINEGKDIFSDLAKLLIDKKPIQYYTNYTYINGRKLLIDKYVLLPGQEMDIMIDVCKKYLGESKKILDLCCGSGVVSVMLSIENSSLQFFATDISKEALNVAQKNILQYSLNNITLLESNLFETLSEKNIRDFDIIVANPPYCKTGDINFLPASVKNYVPQLAIDGGEDGLKFHRQIIHMAPEFLKPNGLLILENENGQSAEVQDLLRGKGFQIIENVKNHLQQERIIVAQFVG